MKKTIKNLVIGGILALASILPTKTKALGGFIEYIQPIEQINGNYIRSNFFYELPEKIKGFSAIEMYKGGIGYFGETYLEKGLAQGFSLESQIQHNNTPINRAGFGISKQIPTPKETFLKLIFYPIWIDKKGMQKNTAEIAYFGEAKLPYELTLSSLGDLTLSTNKEIQWSYGEIDLGKEIAKGVKLSYNPALLNKGNAIPKIEHRVTTKINF